LDIKAGGEENDNRGSKDERMQANTSFYAINERFKSDRFWLSSIYSLKVFCKQVHALAMAREIYYRPSTRA